MSEPQTKVEESKFFDVRANSVLLDAPLGFDVYLSVSGRPTLFRKKGDVLTQDRMVRLQQHGGQGFLVPLDQRALYLDSLKSGLKDPSATRETKSRMIKESAFIHVHDLFTKQDLTQVVDDAKSLVDDMVTFVTGDVEALGSLLRLSVHDYYTYNHCVDVSVYSIAIAKRVVGEDKDMLIMAGLGGLLHDVGKRRLAWDLINKAGKLSQQDWVEIKKHPTYGKEILENNPAIPEGARRIVFEHHENFDGTGYPQGLSDEKIGVLSRITTIADVFDALTTRRSYHAPVPASEAMSIMFGMQPGKFDPVLFEAFNKRLTTKSPLEAAPDFDPCSIDPLSKVKAA